MDVIDNKNTEPIPSGKYDTGNKPVDYTAKGTTIQADDNQSAMDVFLNPSTKTLDDYKLSDEAKAAAQKRLDSGITLYDAVKNTEAGKALKTLSLDDYDHTSGPEGNLEVLEIDVDGMRSAIAESAYDENTKGKYARVANTLENLQNSGFKVVRAADGRYWVEGEEGGKKSYAINGLLAIKEAIDNFHGKAPEDIIDDNDGEEEIIDDDLTPIPDGTPIPGEALEFKLSDAEKWYLGGLATDVVTTFGGMATKGAAGIGALVSLGGGIASAGAEAYADYLSGKGWGELLGNVGTRLGLEAVEAVTFAPVSMARYFKKASGVGKILRRGLRWMMATQYVDVAVGTNWKQLFDKAEDDITSLTVDDWREVARAVTAVAGATGSVRSHRAAKKDLTNTATNANISSPKVKKQVDATVSKIDRPKAVAGYTKVKDAGKKTKSTISTNADVQISKVKQGSKKAISQEKAALKDDLEDIRFDVKAKAERLYPKGRGNATQKKWYAKKNTAAPLKERVAQSKKTVAAETKAADAKIKDIEAAEAAKIAKVDKVGAKYDKKVTKNLVAKENTKRTKAFEKSTEDAKKTFGPVLGGAKAKRAGKKAGLETKKVEDANIADSKKQGAKIKASKKQLVAKKKELKKVESDINKATDKKFKKKLVKERDEIKAKIGKLDKKIVKQTEGRKSLIGRTAAKARGKVKKAVQVTDVVPNAIVPRGQFANFAALKTLVNSDLPVVGKAGKHKILKGDDARAYLKGEGYSESQVEDLSPAELEKVQRYIKYHRANTEKKRNGGVMKMLIPKKVIKAQGGRVLNKTTGPAGGRNLNAAPAYTSEKRTYITEDGRLSPNNQKTNWWVGEDGKYGMNGNYTDDSTPLELFEESMNGTGEVTINVPNPNDTSMEDGSEVKTTVLDNLTEEEKETIKEVADKEGTGGAVSPETKKKYDAIKYKYSIPKDAPIDYVIKALEVIKPSDFIFRNKNISEGYIRTDVKPTALNTGIIRNMPGLDRNMNKSGLIPRLDSSDAFANYAFKSKAFNNTLESRAKLVEKNAAYIDQQRRANDAIVNQNKSSTVQAMNQNIMAQNRDNQLSAQTRLQARKEKRDYDVKKMGNMLNDFARTGVDIYKEKRNRGLMDEYYKVAEKKNIYATQYAPYVNKLSLEGKQDEIDELNSKFEAEHGYNPGSLDTSLLEIRSQIQQ